MDERLTLPAAPEAPLRGDERDDGELRVERPLEDPRALTILTTEHWSLLSARALVYNEAFARGSMFLTFVSATLVALGLTATSMGFSRPYLLVAAVVLGLDLFVGLATLGRISTANGEDVRFLQGMNRLRHAYHEIVPGLDRYFISGQHDDVRGVFEVYGASEEIMSRPGIIHGFTTAAGMLSVICAALAAAIVAIAVLLLDMPPVVAGAAAVVTLVVGVVAGIWLMNRKLMQLAASMRSIFPTPSGQD